MAWGPLSGCCSNRFWRASSISLIWPTTKLSRAISRCSSAKVFGGSGMPSGVCTVTRRSAAPRLREGRLAQGRFEVANAQPGQGGLYPVHNPRAFPHQAVALAVRPLGVLFGNRGHARHAAMAPFATKPPQEPALEQLGVEPVGFRSAVLPRYRDTRGMDHVSLYSTRRKPARQPKAVAAGFEGKCNPGDRAAGPDRLIPPAMQQGKQPFWAWFELLARLTLNPGKHAATSQVDWLSSTTAMIVLFWSRATRDLLRACPGAGRGRLAGASRHSIVRCSDEVAIPRRPPHSVSRSRCPAFGTHRFGTVSCRPPSRLRSNAASASSIRPWASRLPRESGVCVRKFDPDRRVIARPFAGPHLTVHAGGDQAARNGW